MNGKSFGAGGRQMGVNAEEDDDECPEIDDENEFWLFCILT